MQRDPVVLGMQREGYQHTVSVVSFYRLQGYFTCHQPFRYFDFYKSRRISDETAGRCPFNVYIATYHNPSACFLPPYLSCSFLKEVEKRARL